jgi:2-hydroxymuconate-semialdehyde hydrolase
MPIKEYDLKFEGTTIHCYEGGKGYPILMIHGSGPGTASASNWARVMGPLSRRYHILAMDMIGFGLSGRKPKEPYFDLNMWTRQGQFVLDRLSRRGPVGIIGHSLGGYLTLRIASNNPRVDRVLTQGAVGAKYKANHAIDISWRFPKSEAALRKLYDVVVFNAGPLSDAFFQERLAVINKDGYDEYFSKMFKGNKQRYLDKAVLNKAELKRLKGKAITLLYGAHDTAVPYMKCGVPLADSIPHADLIRLANCGHGPAIEQTEKFLSIARAQFG